MWENRKNKYNNKKVFVGNNPVTNKKIFFDSKKEYARYNDLLLSQQSGIIKNLQRQVKFEIVPKNCDEQAAFYIADFVYERADGKKIIEDVKSAITKKDPLFKLKWKLMKYIYKDYLFIIYDK